MPVIVLEGPDGSGKTTLAEDLQTRLLKVWGEVELLKSPVKEHGWSDNYNTYLRDRANILHDLVGIQDRTPEISESVYGIMRGKPKSRGFAYELYSWVDQAIFFIFCDTKEVYLKGTHRDVEGNLLQDDDLMFMRLLYDQIYFNLRQVVINAHPHTMRVHQYQWTDDGGKILWPIAEWLTMLWPEKHYEIAEALR